MIVEIGSYFGVTIPPTLIPAACVDGPLESSIATVPDAGSDGWEEEPDCDSSSIEELPCPKEKLTEIIGMLRQ